MGKTQAASQVRLEEQKLEANHVSGADVSNKIWLVFGPEIYMSTFSR